MNNVEHISLYLGMVRFDARPAEQFDSERFLLDLEAAVQRCMRLDAELEQLDEEITLNPAFIKRCANDGK